MTTLVKVKTYNPVAMVELMVEHPEYTHADFAAHFGKPASWMSSVLASEVFQMAIAPHKEAIGDPALTATMDERFRALALRSVTVLQERLDSGTIDDNVVLQAAALGIKALGMGNGDTAKHTVVVSASSSESMADKLLAAMDKRDQARTVNVVMTEVKDD